MDKELLAWLNSPRPYQQGVAIYHRLGKDAQLQERLLKGSPARMADELFQALRTIYYQLKGLGPKAEPVAAPVVAVPPAVPAPSPNPELEAACKAEADKAYKALANTRALLLAQCSIKPTPSENSPARVKSRETLAFQLLEMHPEVDYLYDRYRFVKIHGRLPDESPAESEEALPSNPVLQERRRINLLKSINKLKLKPQTPERVAYLQTLNAKLQTVTDAVDQFIRNYRPNPAG